MEARKDVSWRDIFPNGLSWRKVILGLCAVGVASYPYVKEEAVPSPGPVDWRSSVESSTVSVRKSSEDIVVRLGDATSKKSTSTETTSRHATLSKE